MSSSLPTPADDSIEDSIEDSTEDMAPRSKRVWRRRLIALSIGLLFPMLLIEIVVRLAWGGLVVGSEKAILEAETLPLGRALRFECLNSPALWLRRQGKLDERGLYAADANRGLRLRPNVTIERVLKAVPPKGLTFTIHTDALGLRGKPRPPAPPGALIVLAVGDSMTFGEGVEDDETWAAQLEPLLAEAAGRPVRVHNAGVVSFGQQEERDVIRELVPRLKPDLILLQFTVANDVIDNMRWQDKAGPLVENRTACDALENHILLTNPLNRLSRTYRLAIWRWGRHAIKYRYMCEPRHLDRSATLIGELRDEAMRLGTTKPPAFAVVIAPTVVQVNNSPAEWVLNTTRINEGIKTRLEAAKIPVLDPLEALRAAEGETYIPVDRHWTAAGHRVVAQELLPFAQRVLSDAKK